jgi:hypothetical protein
VSTIAPIVLIKVASMYGLIFPIVLIASNIDSPSIDVKTTRVWAKETSELIEAKYWNAPSSTYVEAVNAQGKSNRQASFMWDMGVVLAGYAAGIRLDKATYRPLFDKAFASIEPYWSEARGIKGYAVLPRQSDPDRYYDDNAWVALALAEAFEATKDKRYLTRSIETYGFVVSCEDDKLGGGLYWHESEKKSKHSCTNGPAIVSGLKLYRATKEKRFLETSLRLYQWMKCLQDTDGLYFDAMNLNGNIGRMKWTYNTALMIRANCLFYEITKEAKYRDEAVRVAEAAWKHWYKVDLATLGDEASFAHHLLEAFFDVGGITKDNKWRERALPVLAFVHDHCRSELGLYGHRWDEAPKPDQTEFKLLYQASALRGYARASIKP